jgi:hypothetical protein
VEIKAISCNKEEDDADMEMEDLQAFKLIDYNALVKGAKDIKFIKFKSAEFKSVKFKSKEFIKFIKFKDFIKSKESNSH